MTWIHFDEVATINEVCDPCRIVLQRLATTTFDQEQRVVVTSLN